MGLSNTSPIALLALPRRLNLLDPAGGFVKNKLAGLQVL